MIEADNFLIQNEPKQSVKKHLSPFKNENLEKNSHLFIGALLIDETKILRLWGKLEFHNLSI